MIDKIYVSFNGNIKREMNGKTILSLGIVFYVFVGLMIAELSTQSIKETSINHEEKNTTSDVVPYPEMVLVPAGSFDMGEQDGEFISKLDAKQREFYGISNKLIQIDKPFYLGKYEVTFDQYNYYVKHQSNHNKSLKQPPAFKGKRGNLPVVNISWHDAINYAFWLGKQTGRECRLPTEAEWEYAARAGSQTAYPWGDNLGINNANCKGCGSHWDNRQPAPVGSFAANAFGLHDMSGNVWEWTCSSWQDELKGQEQRCSNGDMPIIVVRGGSWQSNVDHLRSAARGINHPSDSSDYHGFRVMCLAHIE
jgi:formylglycine-generating enzyme required for sulfatase activity